MRDGQGCLLPVRHSLTQLPSHDQEPPLILSWSFHKPCRATAPPPFTDASPSGSAAANPIKSAEVAENPSKFAEAEASPRFFLEVDSRSANPSRSAEADLNPSDIAAADLNLLRSAEPEVEASFSGLAESVEAERNLSGFAKEEKNPAEASRPTEPKENSSTYAQADTNPENSAEANPIQSAKAQENPRIFAVAAEERSSRSSAANPSRFREADAEGTKRLRTGYGNEVERKFGEETETFEAAGKMVCHSDNDISLDQQQPLLPGLDDEAALRCLAFVPLSDLGRLAMVNSQYRDLVKSRLIFKLRQGYGVVEHWVFMYASGPGGWIAYDAIHNVWKSLPPANVDPSFNLSDRESLSAGTHVLWLGKGTIGFVYYRYDLVTNSWEKGPSMGNPRCLFASASHGEFAFVAGGFGPVDDSEGLGGLKLLNSAERYNSLSGQWEPLPPMSTPRHKSSGFFMDGKFYVIGGRDAHHQPIMSGEEYNPITNTWRTIENMYFAPETSGKDIFEPSPPLVAVVKNRLYAVENTTSMLKLYDKHTNTWRNLGYLPVRADLRNGWGVAFKALGDRLFVMGDLEGIAACCWQPGPDVTIPEWQLLCHRERGTDSFLFNCAVMAC